MEWVGRSKSVNDIAFTAAVTIASRVLILRDELLGRLNTTPPQDSQSLETQRCSINSGSQVLDAVLVTPAKERAQASLLICYGIGETVDHWLGVQRMLAAQGVASLVFDYAGFGRSTGSIQWTQCEKDSIAAFEKVKSVLPDAPVSILGFSLGSGVAAAILDSVSARQLILCSSFTSFQAAAHCAGLPRAFRSLTPPIWNTEEALREHSLPVLILHSENDRLFPVRMASNLALSCGERARLVVVADHQHNDPFYRPRHEYWAHVVSMLVDES